MKVLNWTAEYEDSPVSDHTYLVIRLGNFEVVRKDVGWKWSEDKDPEDWEIADALRKVF